MMLYSKGRDVVMHSTVEWDIQCWLRCSLMNNEDINISKIVDMQRENPFIEDAEWGNSIINCVDDQFNSGMCCPICGSEEGCSKTNILRLIENFDRWCKRLIGPQMHSIPTQFKRNIDGPSHGQIVFRCGDAWCCNETHHIRCGFIKTWNVIDPTIFVQ